MNTSNVQIQLHFFRSYGKFDKEGILKILDSEYIKYEERTYADMAAISQRVKDVCSGYIKDGGYIYVNVPEIGYPILVKNNYDRFNQSKKVFSIQGFSGIVNKLKKYCTNNYFRGEQIQVSNEILRFLENIIEYTMEETEEKLLEELDSSIQEFINL